MVSAVEWASRGEWPAEQVKAAARSEEHQHCGGKAWPREVTVNFRVVTPSGKLVKPEDA